MRAAPSFETALSRLLRMRAEPHLCLRALSLDELALVFAVLRERGAARVIADIRAAMVARPPGRIFPAQAAVDRDIRAGDEARLVGREKHRGEGEVGRARETSERDHLEVIVARIEAAPRRRLEIAIEDFRAHVGP